MRRRRNETSEAVRRVLERLGMAEDAHVLEEGVVNNS